MPSFSPTHPLRSLVRTGVFIGATVLALVACNSDPGGGQGPTLGALQDQTTTLGEAVVQQVIITNGGTAPVTLSAASSNEDIVDNAALEFSGTGATRELTLTPSSDTPGTAVITVTAKDANGRTDTESFNLEVTEPFTTQPVTLSNDDQVPMGASVAISDRFAAVGAFESVCVFQLINGDWVVMQKLTPAMMNGFPTNFGNSVDIDGERLIVGADSDYDGGERAGAAYIFELVNGTWTESLKLRDPVATAFDSMGRSVAIDGEYAFVGAQNDVYDGVRSGSVFVFQDDEQFGWGLWGKLGPDAPVAAHVFGESVAASDQTLIVGDCGDPLRGVEAGSATVFRLNVSTWELDQTLAPLELEAGDQFGTAVAIDGDHALVSSWSDDDQGANAGAVYVFLYDGTTWQQAGKLTANDAAANDGFGRSVALEMPYAIVGSSADADSLNGAGAAYIFRFDGTTWHQVAKLTSPTPTANTEFSWGVGIAGSHVIASQGGAAPLVAIFER